MRFIVLLSYFNLYIAFYHICWWSKYFCTSFLFKHGKIKERLQHAAAAHDEEVGSNKNTHKQKKQKQKMKGGNGE